MKSLLFFLTLFSCGTLDQYPPKPGSYDTVVDERLREYVDYFMNKCNEHGLYQKCSTNYRKTKAIRFGSHPVDAKNPRAIGVAKTTIFDKFLIDSEVVISSDYEWNENLLKLVLIHELGHAILGLNHVDKFAHIMSPYANFTDKWDWEEKMDEMFEVAKNPASSRIFNLKPIPANKRDE